LKILFITQSLTEGGKERRLTELMKALKLNSNIEFELALLSHDVHYTEVYELGINLHFFIRKSRKDLSVFHQLYLLCKSYKPDIVHCWDSITAIYITPACKLLRIKIVNGMVNDSPQRKNIFYPPWLRARLTFPFADVIVGNSQAGLNAYSAPGKKSITIYNGFDFERTEKLIPKETVLEQLRISTEFIIGMVATFSEFKDYATYYIAGQILLNKRKDVTFLAIGDNTDSELSKSHIDVKLMDHFRLLGSKTGIESYINLLDIGILSTFTEGVSNSILEYMALGKPVIATFGGGTSEIVLDKITGILINPSDPIQLAEKMEQLLNDQSMRSEMGLRGKERIKEIFSINKMADKYLTVYNNLLKKQGNPMMN